ncbi:MAG: hypothetical protein D6814_05470 [Calditrichaeota bacterium]|nr:MAG: hypothetical protein D6814_05470 [Calditrichota bacterium]
MKSKSKNPILASQRYRKQALTFQKSLLLSLIICLMIFFAARYIRVITPMDLSSTAKELKLLKLEEILKVKPPAPKPPRALRLQPPQVVREEPVPDRIKTPIRPVPDRRKIYRQTPEQEVRLELAANTDFDPVAAPDIALAAERRFKNQARGLDEHGPQLEPPTPADEGVYAAPHQIDLDLKENAVAHPQNNGETLDLTLPEEVQAPISHEDQEQRQIEDILHADVSLILTSTDLNMGEDEYQLWNRINAEFDRWDKGRYGPFPAALYRKGRAIIANFSFAGDRAQTIVWLRGMTKIYVKSEKQSNRLTELKNALRALIQLNLKRNRH